MSQRHLTLNELQRNLEKLYLLRESRDNHVRDLVVQKKNLEEQIEKAKKIDEEAISKLTASLNGFLSSDSLEKAEPADPSPDWIQIQVSPPGPLLEEMVLHPVDLSELTNHQNNPLYALEAFSEQFKGVIFPFSVLRTLLPPTDIKTKSFYKGDCAYWIRASDVQDRTYFVFWTMKLVTDAETLWNFKGMITCPEKFSGHLESYIHDELKKRDEKPR